MSKKIVIIGGGIIGLGLGWQLAKSGLTVSVYDRARIGRGATWAAAGMLSPLVEANTQETDLLRLGMTSADLYSDWVSELETDSDQNVDYCADGTLMIALHRDDRVELEHHYETQLSFDLPVKWLSGAEIRDLEPYLSPRVSAGIFSEYDRQVDNRSIIEALAISLKKFGGKIFENSPIERIETQNGKVIGVRIADGKLIKSDCVVLAAGAWSNQIDGLPKSVLPPVRPVKGQVLTVKMPNPPILTHVVFAPDAYLAPKKDGRLVIGATSEEQGFDLQITAGGVMDLLRGAWEALPGVYDLPLIETISGLRPGSRDNAPILGKTEIDGLIMATGHFRKGILLAPITTKEISALIQTDQTSEIIRPFAIERFN